MCANTESEIAHSILLSYSHRIQTSLLVALKLSAMKKSSKIRSLMLAVLVAASGIQVASGFVPNPEKHGRRLQPLHEYVPDGMDPAKWRQLKEKEKNAKANKNYGAYGPSSFKSRSLQAFHKDLEKGKVRLFVSLCAVAAIAIFDSNTLMVCFDSICLV